MSAVEVKCWMCGFKGRRLPKGEPLKVVGRKRKVQPHGLCPGRKLGDRCNEPLLEPADARFVLRAAIQNDNNGGNSMSEFDR